MDEFKIERGIPAPSTALHFNTKYPFSKMKIGDSFAFDGSPKVVNAARVYAGHRGWKFACRKQPDGFSRIWRIK